MKAISYHTKLTDDKNYLNLNHSSWNHPGFKNQKHNESFLELYLIALHKANETISNVNAYLKDTKKVDLKKVFTNLSYVSGKNCNTKNNFKYFE